MYGSRAGTFGFQPSFGSQVPGRRALSIDQSSSGWRSLTMRTTAASAL